MACALEVGEGSCTPSYHYHPKMADAIMVPEDSPKIHFTVSNKEHRVGPSRNEHVASNGPQVKIDSTVVQLGGSEDVPLSETAEQLIDGSTRKKTKVKYNCVERKWLNYCQKNNIDSQATTNTFLNFLAEEFDRNLKHSYIRGYTSALTPYITNVDYTLLRKLMKGIHNERRSTPRYIAIWDVNIVLSYIGAMTTNDYMDLTLKTVALFMILSGSRVNMLSHFKVSNMKLTDTECTFLFNDVLKTTSEGEKSKKLTYKAYPYDHSLCPVKTMLSYLEARGEKSASDHIFTITVKPFRPAKSDTIANWLKKVLTLSGIDSGKYTAHSYRSASTSAAAFCGVSLTTIMKSASWKNVGTFKDHYLRELEERYNLDEDENFGEELLKSYYSIE